LWVATGYLLSLLQLRLIFVDTDLQRTRALGWGIMEAICENLQLPRADFAEAWDTIKIEPEVRTRLVAQALLSLQLRQKYTFEAMPVHGFLLLSGPPGTGKTTLARGLANEVARALPESKVRFLQIDAHALGSSSHGKSQKEVTKLFQQTIPEFAITEPTIVLLDEVETLAADRQRMSLESNPIDAHRATDAALSGIDLLCRKHRNTLLLATTNFPKAVDRALMSRADWIEEVGLPTAEVRQEIIADALIQLAKNWPQVANLKSQMAAFVRASDGLDGRRLRKAMISAAASSIETGRDLNKLRPEHILQTLKLTAAIEQTRQEAAE
jgi:pachytene checkpoint protein 2